jgi:phosphatidylethanolamine-binding protein
VTAGPPQFALSRSEGTNTSPATDGPFVIAVVDPDAPTPQAPTVAQFLHFIGGGYYHPEDATQSPQRRWPARKRSPGLENLMLVNNTPAIIDFLQPQPPAGSDPHR